MSGASGLPEEPTLKAFVRRELERLPLYNHHREELRDARTRWWFTIDRGGELGARDLQSSPPTE